jgi:hypothetical protein
MKTLKYTTLLSVLVILLISSYGNHSKQSNEILAMTESNLSDGACEMNGIKLYGKVKFVSGSADLKIKYVSSFGDIKVKFVESFPNDCGEWQKVESFPDFTVEVVESFADLKVEVVSSFPGMN